LGPQETDIDIRTSRALVERMLNELEKAIAGKRSLLENIIVAFLARGHVLLEGPPGLGKTLIARSLAKVSGCTFKRIQCTPDMLPSDVIGSYVYVSQAGTFKFRKGPIFANVVLADEINRAPPKSQAAFLEAMQERQVTVEGTLHLLPDPFFVIATMNPLEMTGVYPLPEAQIDRFLFKLVVDYPSEEEELEIIYGKGFDRLNEIEAVASPDEIRAVQQLVDKVYLDDKVASYILDLTRGTRDSDIIVLGASSRAAVSLAKAAKARALIYGRSYVIPDDVKALLIPTLRHRLRLRPEAELEGISIEDVIKSVLRTVKVR
jgi:MoxR-like ATPase